MATIVNRCTSMYVYKYMYIYIYIDSKGHIGFWMCFVMGHIGFWYKFTTDGPYWLLIQFHNFSAKKMKATVAFCSTIQMKHTINNIFCLNEIYVICILFTKCFVENILKLVFTITMFYILFALKTTNICFFSIIFFEI